MKRIILLFVLSGFFLSCGANKEAVSDSSVTEDQIARSLVQQEGERPKLSPESLSPKVPPQNIISSSAVAPSVIAVKAEGPKTVPPKPMVKPVEEDSLETADTLATIQMADTLAAAVIDTVSAETAETVDSMATVVVKDIALPETSEETSTEEGLKLQNLSFDDIYFENKEWAMPSSTFNSNYYVTLGKIVKALRSDPEIKVRILGYTDYEGSEQFNYQLSEKRAITFGKILIDLFPAEMRDDIAQRIEINPKGSQELLVESSNKARRTLNRRVSFELFYGDMRNNPFAVYLEPGSQPISSTSSQASVKRTTSSTMANSMQQKLYDKAMALFNQKRYFEATEIFNEIIAIDTKHSLADNAQFWIAEALYYQNKYPEALQAYLKVFGTGDGNKEAAAQMRLGYCYFRMNQLEQATTEFRKVIEHYPDAQEEIQRSEKVLSKIRSN